MDIAAYRQHIKTFIRYTENRSLDYLTNGLLSEIGEVIGVLAKEARGDYRAEAPDQHCYEWERYHRALLKEMGDVWFMIVLLADEIGCPVQPRDVELPYSHEVGNEAQCVRRLLRHCMALVDEVEKGTERDLFPYFVSTIVIRFCKLAVSFGFDLNEIMAGNIEKLEDRVRRGVVMGSERSW